MKKETWKAIPNFEGLYEISTKGRVKSFVYNHKKIERIINPHKCGVKRRNYNQVTLYKKSLKYTKRIHWLMAVTYRGHTEGDGMVVDHVDNDYLNDNLENIQLLTIRQNTSKDRKGGTSKYIGVHKAKGTKKWKAVIGIDGKNEALGSFNNELDASKAYQDRLKVHISSGGK